MLITKNFIRFFIIVMMVPMIIAGCEGSNTKEAVNNAVHTLSGADAVKKGERIKEQLDEISEKESQRTRSGLGEQSSGDQAEQPGQ